MHHFNSTVTRYIKNKNNILITYQYPFIVTAKAQYLPISTIYAKLTSLFYEVIRFDIDKLPYSHRSHSKSLLSQIES